MRISLVSSFLPDVTQQIHSFRASGVIPSHTARAAGVEISAFCKSSGSLCTVPVASSFLVIRLFYQFFGLAVRVEFIDEVRGDLDGPVVHVVFAGRAFRSFGRQTVQRLASLKSSAGARPNGQYGPTAQDFPQDYSRGSDRKSASPS